MRVWRPNGQPLFDQRFSADELTTLCADGLCRLNMAEQGVRLREGRRYTWRVIAMLPGEAAPMRTERRGFWVNDAQNVVDQFEKNLALQPDDIAASTFLTSMPITIIGKSSTEELNYWEQRPIYSPAATGIPSLNVGTILHGSTSFDRFSAARSSSTGALSLNISLLLSNDPGASFNISTIRWGMDIWGSGYLDLLYGDEFQLTVTLYTQDGPVEQSYTCTYIVHPSTSLADSCSNLWQVNSDLAVTMVVFNLSSTSEVTSQGPGNQKGIRLYGFTIETNNFIEEEPVSIEAVGLFNGSSVIPLEKPAIPYRDEIRFTFKIKNTTDRLIRHWDLQILNVKLNAEGAQSNPDDKNVWLLVRQRDGDGTYHNLFTNVFRWGWRNEPIVSNGIIEKTVGLASARSGPIVMNYKLRICFEDETGCNESNALEHVGIARVEGNLNEIAITNIEFDDAVKSAIFWAIFNETSEDVYSSGNFADLWITAMDNLNSSYDAVYHPIGYPTPNEDIFSTKRLSPRAFVFGSEFHAYQFPYPYRTDPYCESSSDLPGNNGVSSEHYRPNIVITHCNYIINETVTLENTDYPLVNADHREFGAHAIINGFLTNERKGEQYFTHLTANYGGSVGKKDYSLWQNPGVCLDDSEGKNSWLQWVEQAPNNYSGIVVSEKDGEKRIAYEDVVNYGKGYRAATEWLHYHLMCMLDSSNPLRQAIYRQAYDNIMPQIDRAIANMGTDISIGAIEHKDVNWDHDADLNTPSLVYIVNVTDTNFNNIIDVTDIHTAYTRLINTISNGGKLDELTFPIYTGEGRFTLIRPVLTSERLFLSNPTNGKTTAFQYGTYKWLAKSFQRGIANLQFHFPR